MQWIRFRKEKWSNSFNYVSYALKIGAVCVLYIYFWNFLYNFLPILLQPFKWLKPISWIDFNASHRTEETSKIAHTPTNSRQWLNIVDQPLNWSKHRTSFVCSRSNYMKHCMIKVCATLGYSIGFVIQRNER